MTNTAVTIGISNLPVTSRLLSVFYFILKDIRLFDLFSLLFTANIKNQNPGEKPKPFYTQV